MATNNGYRYTRFTTRLLFNDFRFGRESARAGDSLPLVELLTMEGDRISIRDCTAVKPLLLIFGSVTCPMTASSIPELMRLYADFGDNVAFVTVNVREAHPGECYPQPDTFENKFAHARALKERFEIPWTVATDDLDGSLHLALDPKPNAAYLADNKGTIVFRSIWAKDEQSLRQALESVLRGERPKKEQSLKMFGPVVRAMGYVQEAMTNAGPQAVRDLWRAGLPMALAGRVATFFYPLSPDMRGIASVTALGVAMIVVVLSGLIWVW